LALAGAALGLIPTIVARPRWLTGLLSLIGVVVAVLLGDALQPEPPRFAGRFEMQVPGATGLRWDIDLHTNLLGNYDRATSLMIGRETYAVPKPAGVFRFVCLGTSQAIGPGVEPDRTWCPLAGEMLQASLPETRVEAINASIFGGDDLMLWLYFDGVVRRLQPDVLLVAWFGRIVPPTARGWRIRTSSASSTTAATATWTPNG